MGLHSSKFPNFHPTVNGPCCWADESLRDGSIGYLRPIHRLSPTPSIQYWVRRRRIWFASSKRFFLRLSNLPLRYRNFNNSRFSSSTQHLKFQFSLNYLRNKEPIFAWSRSRSFFLYRIDSRSDWKLFFNCPLSRPGGHCGEEQLRYNHIETFNSKMGWV